MACGRYPFETGPEIDLVAARQPVRSSLYLRLMDLLASARMGRLDIETLAERGAHLQMDCLLGAAAPFYLAGSVQLRDCLFIGPRALSGAFWATIGARAPRFFVLIVVEAANARALYLRSGRRIDLRDGVSGSVSHAMPVGQMPVGQGPFLALVCAEFDWSGIPQPKSAAVVPVWRRDQFTPLACSHERDMLDCLAAIMERLDCHGTALHCRLLDSLVQMVQHRFLLAVCAATGSSKSSSSPACPATPIVPNRAWRLCLAVKGCHMFPGRQALTNYVPTLSRLPCDADRLCARQHYVPYGTVSCRESSDKDARALLGESSPDSRFKDSELQKARFIVLLSESL